MVHPSRCLRLACTIFDRPDTHMPRQQATYFVSLLPTNPFLPFRVRLSLRQQIGQDMAGSPCRNATACASQRTVSCRCNRTTQWKRAISDGEPIACLLFCEEQRGACLPEWKEGGMRGGTPSAQPTGHRSPIPPFLVREHEGCQS